MRSIAKTIFVFIFVLALLFFLVFSGGAITGSIEHGRILGEKLSEWCWDYAPILLSLGLGFMLAWIIFEKKKL